MSLAVLKSRALAGMEAPEVNVEVHLANGLPAFAIVGLPDTEVKEARHRVQAAILSCGYDMPSQRITVNLAPADLPKESGRFDLPIALGILAASGQIPTTPLDDYEFAGELSLTGELRSVPGALAMAFAMRRQANRGRKRRAFILPLANAAEAALVEGTSIYPAASLVQVCGHFTCTDGSMALPRHQTAPERAAGNGLDLSDVKGQEEAKRVLEIAAAGRHNLLLVGPPGAGKSMLAWRLAGLLPPMTDEEALESAAVLSLAGCFDPARWMQRPFRAPHHTASGPSLVGGGSTPRPGEISLAHGGVLFLDELAEFDRRVLDVLRQPMETGIVTVSRASHHADFPARFQLVGAMNACPCGYRGHASGKCKCPPDTVNRYQGRISGPLLDRIDLQISVNPLTTEQLESPPAADSTAVVAARVAQAFQLQLERQGKCNQLLATREVERLCKLDRPTQLFMRETARKLQLSARAYHRVLRVARTIADLDHSKNIEHKHITEASQYRRALELTT